MLAIASVTFPFFALVGIGYLAARLRVLPLEAVPGLNVFVLYFALTAMLFQLGARTPVAELLDPVVLGVWLLAGLGVLALGAWTARRRGVAWLDSAFGGLIAALSNSGFMGVPLLIALIGPAAAGPVSASLLVDVVVVSSVGVILSRRDEAGAGPGRLWPEVVASFRRMAANPMPWAIVLGGLTGWLGLRLPGPVESVVSMLATAATPVALFTIGAVLARTQLTRVAGTAAWGDVPWLAAVKLLIHPLLVWGLGLAGIAAGLPLDRATLTALVLVAALPAAGNVTLLAERFGADSGRVARVILVSTVASVLTFTLAAALLT